MVRRMRFDVLISEIRIAGALILAFSWPLLCVRATWWALHRLALHTAGVHLAAGATILGVVSYASLVRQPIDRLRVPGTWIGAIRITASAFGAFVLLAVAAPAPLAIIVAPFAVATFTAALAEEVVFRQYLPDRLSVLLRNTGTQPAVTSLANVAIPQLSFALAHMENPTFAGAGSGEFAELFIAGILYRGVTRVGGLWVAAAVHAALNLTIAIAALP